MYTKIPIYVPAIFAGLVCGSLTGLVHADGNAGPLMDVHTTNIESRGLQREWTFYGTVVPEPASESHGAASARVAATIAGRVIAVPATEGKFVRHDEVLVKLDSRQADAAVQRATASLKQARATFERQQTLTAMDDTSRKNFEKAEQQLAAAKAALREVQTQRALLDIKAPLDGAVLQVKVRPGEVVSAGAVVVEIQDIDRLVAEVWVPASQLAEIRAGQEATIQASGKESLGKVNFIGMRIDPVTGTAPVRISLPAGSGLFSGQFVRARVIVETRICLVVPVDAVRHQPDGSGIVAVVTGNQVKLLPVQLGIEEGGDVEITGNGLHEGLQVVTREVYGLPDNARVRIIEP